jgi:polysaccharide deacetylase family protein (PEP-CTERM system associated)
MMVEETRPLNAFTIDLEDWFQGLTSTNARSEQWDSYESRVVEATDYLLAILREHGILATFFVLGYVADQHPDLIERVAGAGHEIGVHGYHHRFVNKMTPEEFSRELDLSLEAIERITGSTPIGHRAPYFSINADTSWAFGVLAGRGLRYDSSVFPTRNMLYGFPGAPRYPYRMEEHDLVEFPATTVRFGGINWPVAGGFYNRALPYTIIRQGIRRVNDLGQPAVLYIHPWELDTGQSYNQVTFRERITHYHGRRGLEKKLHKLLSDFRFGPLLALMENYLMPVTQQHHQEQPVASQAT